MSKSNKIPSVLPVSGPVTLAVETPKVPKEWKPKAIPAAKALLALKRVKVSTEVEYLHATDEQIASRSEKAEERVRRDIAVALESGFTPVQAQEAANLRAKVRTVIGSGPKALKVSPNSRLARLAAVLESEAIVRAI